MVEQLETQTLPITKKDLPEMLTSRKAFNCVDRAESRRLLLNNLFQ